jgi:predicted ATPase/DNA-binding XRE family transcriptional regulator
MQEELSFGIWLRKQRRALDITRRAFAKQVGCAEVTLRHIEAGILKPSKELAGILLERLGISETERPRWIAFARGLSGFPLSSTPPSIKPITNLPTPLTTFIGREKERADIAGLISKHRLVTLTGSGGVGKTRLSIKVGEQVLGNYPDGVWIVEFAPLLDPLLVPRTTAIAIGLREEPQRPVMDMLSDYLHEKKMLLILDNCEHLLDACTHLINAILKSCPHLKMLATSREPLEIPGEAIYRVPSLGIPNLEQLLNSFRNFESVELFEERAQLAQFDFSVTLRNASSVAQICHRLDGIPLAIELAAAKVDSYSPEQIARQLDESFEILTRRSHTILPRHQTLRASIDWSWNLLTESEQRLMRQLSVFTGGWTLEAAMAICDGDVSELTNSLVKKSLIVRNQEVGREPRYNFHEAIRQYANEKLVQSGESDILRDRHLEYFLNLAETAEPHLFQVEQIEWLPLLDADYENLRLAFEWALNKESAEPSLNLCKSLHLFWQIRPYWLEGSIWLTKALAKPIRTESLNEKIARARALCTHANLEFRLGNLEQMQTSAETSLMLLAESSNEKDIAIAKYYLGAALFNRGEDNDRAFSLMEQCYAKFLEHNEPFWQARSFGLLGELLVRQNKLNFHDKILRQLEVARKAGERLTLATALYSYADWLFRLNQVDEARKLAEESDGLYQQLDPKNSGFSHTPFLFAEIAWSMGNYQEARSLYMERYQHFKLTGERGWRSTAAAKLGILAMEEDNFYQAQTYLEEALSIEREGGWRSWEALYLIELGNLYYRQGKFDKFKQNFRGGLSLRNYFPEYHKNYILMTMLGSLYLQMPEMSAQLLGAIDDAERKSGYLRTPLNKRYCHRAEVHAREVLGDDAFGSAFAEGQKMSLDEGLDLALKMLEEMD